MRLCSQLIGSNSNDTKLLCSVFFVFSTWGVDLICSPECQGIQCVFLGFVLRLGNTLARDRSRTTVFAPRSASKVLKTDGTGWLPDVDTRREVNASPFLVEKEDSGYVAVLPCRTNVR